jgi:PKHD-type hydroxylase
MNQWWQMWNGYFTPEECKEIISLGSALGSREGTIGHGGTSNVNDKMRRSKVGWFNRGAEEYQWIFRRLDNSFQFANVNAFNFDLSYFREIQFTEYDASYEGKYDWHEDCTWCRNHPTRRKLSICVQLSSGADYKGGDLEINAQQAGGENQVPDAKRLRELGTTLVFPSFLRHRVTPVTSGKRYSLVSWYEGPPFR